MRRHSFRKTEWSCGRRQAPARLRTRKLSPSLAIRFKMARRNPLAASGGILAVHLLTPL